jgi:hypothetical protein
VADEGLLETNDLSVGDEITISLNSQYVQAKIVGSFELFPTHYTSETDRLLVADLRSLQVLGTACRSSGVTFWRTRCGSRERVRRSRGQSSSGPWGSQQRRRSTRLRFAPRQHRIPVAASWEDPVPVVRGGPWADSVGVRGARPRSATSRGLEFAVLRSMGY